MFLNIEYRAILMDEYLQSISSSVESCHRDGVPLEENVAVFVAVEERGRADVVFGPHLLYQLLFFEDKALKLRVALKHFLDALAIFDGH